MKELDKQEMLKQATEEGFQMCEKALNLFESLLPLFLLAYEQGTNGEEFNVLPVKECV